MLRPRVIFNIPDMKNVPTYLPPPTAQRKVQPAELVSNQRVGVNTELGKYEP